ncbi:MAG: serine hydrolase, partial [Bacteroidota bacterium]
GIPYGLPVEGREELNVPFFASLEDESLEEVANRIAKRPLVHHPGEGWTYGLGIDVAGRVLEVVSGQSLQDYLTEHLWRPLGMKDSYFYLPENKHDRLVTLYSKNTTDGPLTVHENETYRNFAVSGAQHYYSGGAGSVGTIEDYAIFCQLMLNRGTFNGHRLLSPKTVDFMTRNHIGEHEVWSRRDKFGMGFMIITPGSRYGDLSTPGAYKWGGMYCSEYTIDPAEDLVLLFYTNVHPIPQYGEVVRKFRNLVYQALVESHVGAAAGTGKR